MRQELVAESCAAFDYEHEREHELIAPESFCPKSFCLSIPLYMCTRPSRPGCVTVQVAIGRRVAVHSQVATGRKQAESQNITNVISNLKSQIWIKPRTKNLSRFNQSAFDYDYEHEREHELLAPESFCPKSFCLSSPLGTWNAKKRDEPSTCG